MGILSFAARKGVARKAREGLQWQYYESRGEMRDPTLFKKCLLSTATTGYIFGYVGNMVKMMKIGPQNANKAFQEAIVEIFGPEDAADIYNSISRHGSDSGSKEWFNLEADEGEADAENFVLTGERNRGLYARLVGCADAEKEK